MTNIRVYNFRKFANKVLSHSKRVTWRKVRKRPSKEGELMHPYIVFYPGEARINLIKRKKLKDATLKEALADGFNSVEALQKALMEMHDCTLDEEFELTPFKPYWEPLLIVNLVDLRKVREILKVVQWDKNLAKVLEAEIVKCLNLLNDIINSEDPRVDIRKGIEAYLKEEKQ